MKKNKKKQYIGIISLLLIIIICIMILSCILNIAGISAQNTSINNGLLETSLVTINNIFTKDGIRFLIGDVFSNIHIFEPVLILIMSVICTSILQSSGIINALFSKFRKLKTPIVTFLTLLISILFVFFGEYSYLFLFPFIGAVYETIGRNPMVGIITVFLGTTFGYGYGIFMNNDQYLLGILTQQSAALDVDPSYKFNIFSTNYIMVIGTVLLAFVLTFLIEKNIMSKYKKIEKTDGEYNTSKKNLLVLLILSLVFFLIIVFSILPNSFLLDTASNNYMEKLFGEASVIKNGFMYIILIIFILIGFIYGKMTNNLNNDLKRNLGLSVCFENLGYVFVIIIFSFQLISILDYTNIGTVFITELTNLISIMDFSGMFLILTFIMITIVMTAVVPDLIHKWTLMAPTIVPLFMRANITPEFCQFLYIVSNSIARSITPVFIYLLIMMGFMQKYNTEDIDITYGGTMKIIMPTILWTTGIMMVFILLWYISGLPVGIGGYPTL